MTSIVEHARNRGLWKSREQYKLWLAKLFRENAEAVFLRCSVEKVFLEISQKSLFFNKVAVLRRAT